MNSSFFFKEVFAVGHERLPERERETESEKSPPRGDVHAAIPFPPFSSWDLGHACTGTRHEFKSPGLGLEPQSTMWESSDIAITPSAGPYTKVVTIRS